MPKSRAIKGVDEDMKLNKALWEMAGYFETAEHNKDSSKRGSGSNPPPKLWSQNCYAIFSVSP
jgi:hypothetical protein